MTYAIAHLLEQIAPGRLHDLVCQVLNRPDAALDGWQATTPFSTGGGIYGSAIFRLEGVARTTSGPHPWSVILKLFPARQDDTPDSPHYWRREVEAYRSGWLHALPGGVTAPRCHAIDLYDDWALLWLEDVHPAQPGGWTLARAAIAARHLGAFNGAYLAGTPLPAYPWLSRDWLRQEAERVGPRVEPLRHPPSGAAAALFTPARRAALLRIYDEREILLDALDALPPVAMHGDAYSRNLLWRDDTRTIAIDWAFVGIGPLGSEIGALVEITLAYGDTDPAGAEAFHQAVFDAYLAGLNDAGWRGDPHLPRLGCAAAAAFRHLFSMLYLWEALADEATAAALETGLQQPLAHLLRQWTRTADYLDGVAEEARRLLMG